ncbi:MAG: arylsulfatase, partial [Sphingomonadaceae bacterium]
MRRLLSGLLLVASPAVAQTGTILPVPEAPFAGKIGETYADSVAAMPKPVRAPAGAPNVLLILTDDVGFAAASTFGGPVPTPSLDRLAARGLIYNRFHTTAMCSPTRASLLTGRNHHAVATGLITDLATGFPGYWATIPRSAATVAEILRQNGWNTGFFGKHHNVPGALTSAAGPFDLWPTGLGFEYFYGFVGGDTNQWRPKLYRGTTPVEHRHHPDRTLDSDLSTDLIHWIHNQQAAAPDKPFFAYLAPGSAHAPHQAPADWIARFKGKFDQGWDRLREESFARQKALGIIPADTALTPRPEAVPAWDSLSPDERRVHARMMEVYAGMLAYQDAEIGRVLAELDRMGEAENTLVLFIEGDNGASAEGGPEGDSNEIGVLANGVREDTGWLLKLMPEMGGPESYQIFSAGWAWATNAPFAWTKQVASHLGGIRNGLVVSWPKGIAARGIRSQFSHVTDIMPTILDATGVAMPRAVNGAEQQRVDGVSLTYSFADADAPERHRTQYFELMGNRGIYADGWFANTTPRRAPWDVRPVQG